MLNNEVLLAAHDKSLIPGNVRTVSLSIIIVTYNGRQYLDANLTSVAGELNKNTDVIVVDNASTDGGDAFICRAFPWVRLLQNRSNIGFAAACNQGAVLARGDILVFLNQDTRVASGWLQALVEPLKFDDTVGLTTSKVLLMSDPDRLQLAGQNVHYTGLVFGRGFMDPADLWDKAGDVAAVSGASFAIRRELWEALGGFDETFYMYYEETDLSWRAQLLGYDCCYIPASVVYHDYHPGRISTSLFYYSNRNRYIMLLKNWRWSTLLLLLPGILLAEFVDWFLALARRWSGIKAKFRASWWLVTHLGCICKAHNSVHRVSSDFDILRRMTPNLEARVFTAGLLGNFVLLVLSLLMRVNYVVAFALGKFSGI